MANALAEELTNNYKDWFAAITSDGIGPLQTMLADEWVYTNYDGLVRGKRDYIEWIASVSEAAEFVGPYDVVVGRFGEIAAVFGVYRVQHPSGEPDLPLRFTGLWVERDDRWQCLAHHNSQVAG